MRNILLFNLFLFIGLTAVAQSDALRLKHFNAKKGIALEGYDPVSYFDGKPTAGSTKLKFSYKGITYLFASSTSLNRFKTKPEKFEPAYGGWCAFAMGETGEKVKIDPETYKITDGKLYLFYNFWGNNTQEEWNKREAKLKEAADRNWSKNVR